MISQLTKLLLVLFLASTVSFSRSRSIFANAQDDDLDIVDEEDIDAWDSGDDDDGAAAADPWDNTGDYEQMDGALPSSVWAVIHLSHDTIMEQRGLMEFIQYELPFYPQLSAQNIEQKTTTIRFFDSMKKGTDYTVSEALENDAVPEEQMGAIKDLPPREEVLTYPLAEVDISQLSADEIMGVLADHNVHREESDDDLDALDEESDEPILGEDGEPVEAKPRRRKKKKDWRKRRAARLEREEKEKKENKGKSGTGINLTPNVGLAIPGPILFLLVCGGFGGAGYLGYILMQTQEATLAAEERKRAKAQKKNEKRLKRESAKTKKKR